LINNRQELKAYLFLCYLCNFRSLTKKKHDWRTRGSQRTGIFFFPTAWYWMSISINLWYTGSFDSDILSLTWKEGHYALKYVQNIFSRSHSKTSQKLKSKHLVCLSILWWEVFWGIEREYFAHILSLSATSAFLHSVIYFFLYSLTFWLEWHFILHLECAFCLLFFTDISTPFNTFFFLLVTSQKWTSDYPQKYQMYQSCRLAKSLLS
jgi:hypothetical protein